MQLTEVVKRLFGVDVTVELTPAPEETGADYASNVALKLAKVVGKSPREIASEIGAELEKLGYQSEVAGPGFLNFSLGEGYFAEKIQEMSQMIASDNYSSGEYSGQTMVVEFSDPNPFKVLHVGHLYTSAVGDAISRLLEFAGAKVVRANFGGDVGLHVGKTLWAVMQHHYSPDDITIGDIAACYVEGTAAYEEDASAKTAIVELNKMIYRIAALGKDQSEALGGQEGEVAKLYWRGRGLSYQYFDDFYAQIGLKFDKYYPESTVADRGLAEVKGHIGSTYEVSDGAVVYRGEKVGLHTRVFINREGVPTYEAKDVGLIFTKWDDWHFDKSIVITGNEQTDYMKVVLASVSEYAPELVERTAHLTHGMVRLPGNVKMSSRKGNFLKAVEVIELIEQELAESSSVEARSRHPSLRGRAAHPRRDSGSSTEENQPTPATSLITLAAIKYAFLKYKVGGDIVFDPKESVSTSGNSGVYLLYAAVRAQKILQNTGKKTELNKKFIQLEDTPEQAEVIRKLNKKIVQYDEIIRGAVADFAPYKICNYLYELAQGFSKFYEMVPVAGSEHEVERRAIVEAYLSVMRHGLGILGIEIPEEM